MPRARGPGQRAGLTRPAVLAAARELLAQAGPDALSMRALARRLDVAPNALYSHVADKTDLLDGVLDDVLGAVQAPAEGDPVAALTVLLTSTWVVLTEHADLVPLYLTRQGARGQNAVRLGAVMDGLLARAGVPPEEVDDARVVLVVHVLGSAAYATSAPAASRGPTDGARRTFARSLQWLLTGIVQADGAGRSDESCDGAGSASASRPTHGRRPRERA